MTDSPDEGPNATSERADGGIQRALEDRLGILEQRLLRELLSQMSADRATATLVDVLHHRYRSRKAIAKVVRGSLLDLLDGKPASEVGGSGSATSTTTDGA